MYITIAKSHVRDTLVVSLFDQDDRLLMRRSFTGSKSAFTYAQSLLTEHIR